MEIISRTVLILPQITNTEVAALYSVLIKGQPAVWGNFGSMCS
jgi:hypothetical protein